MAYTAYRYAVRDRAREIARAPQLDILELRKYLGVPLANDMRRWLGEQPPQQPLHLDFTGIRAVTLSVAEEVGPLLMQTVGQNPALEQRYPVYHLRSPEPTYTFARAFANLSGAAVAIVEGPPEPAASITTMEELDNDCTIVVLGQISAQMEQILRLADKRSLASERLTSENLTELDFLTNVSAAARSKRLTELYARRLLAFEENPRNPRERLFIPVWRLPER